MEINKLGHYRVNCMEKGDWTGIVIVPEVREPVHSFLNG